MLATLDVILGLTAYTLMYMAALALTSAGALWWGGAPERHGAAAMVGAWLATRLAILGTSAGQNDYEAMAVDALLLALLLALALRTDRFWPLWATAFHLASMTVHLAKVVDPTVAWMPYLHANAFWAYPMLLALMIGAWFEGPGGRRRASA